MKKQPKLLQKNKLLRSSIITLVGLAILVTVIYWIAPFFEEIQSLGLSLEFTPFFFPLYPFFLSLYKCYVLVLIANLFLCIDIWRRKIHTQEYLKQAFIFLKVILFLESAMWLLFLYIYVEIIFSFGGGNI
ncbi:MAG: hypothetical protein VSS75_019070 [Candidatus Parabeggiatoa sp.]|nr:hypothetical protein [Candidatus Parabeggiatoa sp.]